MDRCGFRDLFQQDDAPAARGKFLSRLFGIFSETIVQIWSEDERAPYRNLGRPTLSGPSQARAPTLDFLFECRRTGRRFVVEQKCEIEFNGFRYFTLTAPDQLTHQQAGVRRFPCRGEGISARIARLEGREQTPDR